MDLAKPADAHHVRDATCVVSICLFALGRQCLLHVNGLDHDGRQTDPAQLGEQLRRKRLRLETDAVEAIRVAIESGADRRWLRLRLAFFDDLAIVVDDANARFIHRHVQTGIELHGDLLGCIAARESGQLCAFCRAILIAPSVSMLASPITGQPVGGWHPAVSARHFAKLQSDKNRARHPSSSFGADSLQRLCGRLAVAQQVMFVRSTEVWDG
jgi:hypothetical protein